MIGEKASDMIKDTWLKKRDESESTTSAKKKNKRRKSKDLADL